MIMPSDFQLWILKFTEFIFQDSLHFAVAFVILLIIFFSLLGFFLSLDDRAWQSMTFMLMIFFVIGMLYMFEGEHLNFTEIEQAIRTFFVSL